MPDIRRLYVSSKNLDIDNYTARRTVRAAIVAKETINARATGPGNRAVALVTRFKETLVWFIPRIVAEAPPPEMLLMLSRRVARYYAGTRCALCGKTSVMPRELGGPYPVIVLYRDYTVMYTGWLAAREATLAGPLITHTALIFPVRYVVETAMAAFYAFMDAMPPHMLPSKKYLVVAVHVPGNTMFAEAQSYIDRLLEELRPWRARCTRIVFTTASKIRRAEEGRAATCRAKKSRKNSIYMVKIGVNPRPPLDMTIIHDMR